MKIAIVGAGLMGRLLAFEFLQRDEKIEIDLFDRDLPEQSRSCAMSAAGLISPFAELEKSDLLLAEAGLESLMRWPEILSCLKEKVYFQKAGSLVTAHASDTPDLQRYLQKIPRQSAVLPFQSCDLTALEPELSPFMQGYYFSEEGQIDAQALIRALSLNLQASVRWHYACEITEFKPGYDWTFDCRGMGGGSSFPELRPVRGELICLHAPEVQISRPIRLVHPRYHIYIVPRPGNRYLVGASEVEALDYSEISVRAMMELLSSAYSLHKGFIEARVLYTTTNCRPTLPHHSPRIQYKPGFMAVNGLYRHGLMLAPVLVNEIVSYVTGSERSEKYLTWWEPYGA